MLRKANHLFVAITSAIVYIGSYSMRCNTGQCKVCHAVGHTNYGATYIMYAIIIHGVTSVSSMYLQCCLLVAVQCTMYDFSH